MFVGQDQEERNRTASTSLKLEGITYRWVMAFMTKI